MSVSTGSPKPTLSVFTLTCLSPGVSEGSCVPHLELTAVSREEGRRYSGGGVVIQHCFRTFLVGDVQLLYPPIFDTSIRVPVELSVRALHCTYEAIMNLSSSITQLTPIPATLWTS